MKQIRFVFKGFNCKGSMPMEEEEEEKKKKKKKKKLYLCSPYTLSWLGPGQPYHCLALAFKVLTLSHFA
jgi:hypothetical protein